MSHPLVNVNRDYHKVMIVGSSGMGKTFSFRDLPETTTGFINVENKPLPFRKKFKYHAKPQNPPSVLKALMDYANNPEIELIVIDSFSAYIEMLLALCRKDKKGFDVWNLYNEEIGRLFGEIKKINKEVFITAHYEMLNIEGNLEKRVKVKGKEWEGLIEKEFTVVLYSENKYLDNDKYEYCFRLRGEGLSAKCPPELFGDVNKVPNDCKYVYDKIIEFVS